MTKRVFFLKSEQIRRRCQEAVWNADDGDKVTITPPGKTRDQEEKYHAQSRELAVKISESAKQSKAMRTLSKTTSLKGHHA